MEEKSYEIAVFISSSTKETICGECKETLGKHAWITLRRDKGVLCLACADLDHLVFLPAGDVALTRRTKKYSKLWAVVLKWSQARKRYERQGLLVEEEALAKAEEECLGDQEAREQARLRSAGKRAEMDQNYVRQFAARIRELFPKCPKGRETGIAEHACAKHSGRVGRCAAAKELDEKAVRAAVIAHIRHRETNYDDLLLGDIDRITAREQVGDQVRQVLAKWQS